MPGYEHYAGNFFKNFWNKIIDPWKKFSQKINEKAWYCCQKCIIVKEKNCENFYTIAQFFEEKFFVKFLDVCKNF